MLTPDARQMIEDGATSFTKGAIEPDVIVYVGIWNEARWFKVEGPRNMKVVASLFGRAEALGSRDIVRDWVYVRIPNADFPVGDTPLVEGVVE